MATEKNFFFLQLHNTILQQVKEFINLIMINFEKTLFKTRRPTPAAYYQNLF